MSWGRVSVSAILLLGLTVAFHSVSHGEDIPFHHPLDSFPRTIGSWQGQDVKVDPRLADALKADDVLTRAYNAANLPTVWLYVAYFQSQRQGQTIHSPKNCLPGSGWTPLDSKRETIEVGEGQRVNLNRYVVRNGLDRQLVLYWYQSHGRTVASEYVAKMDMVVDAIKMNRTDGALIRVSLPIEEDDLTAEAAEKIAREYVRKINSPLKEYIPQ
jgi:EpsI family protein